MRRGQRGTVWGRVKRWKWCRGRRFKKNERADFLFAATEDRNKSLTDIITDITEEDIEKQKR